MIGAGWMAFGLSSCPNVVRVPLGLAGLGLVWCLLRGSRMLLHASRDLPEADFRRAAAYRRVWIWFWVNLVAEIVLLNVAVGLLRAPELHIYWISAVSGVVGLHFLPMAVFMEVPSYWVCGGAFIALAAATAAALEWSPFPPVGLVATEAIVNAFILWATVAWSIRPQVQPT